MLLIYSDWRVFNQNSYFLESLSSPYIVTNNLNDYLSATTDYKVAITSQRFQKVFGQTINEEFIALCNQISRASDLVFIHDPEVHNECQLYPQCGSNVYWAVPAVLNFDFQENIIFNGAWFYAVCNLYQNFSHKLQELRQYDVKNKMFDALLGLEKPHRTFVYDSVINNKLNDQFVLSYYGKTNQWIDTVDTNTIVDKRFTSFNRTMYEGIETGFSQIIPIDIYNQTAYSIIAETNYDNSFSFFTEKTAKPIISRRLFVPFSGQYFLNNLKKVGFKTFDIVIDESFDQIENYNERWKMAFEQVIKLTKMNQREVLDSIQPILEHNYNLLVNTNWFNQEVNEILNKIKQLTKQIN
jgi:hypothetical protein